LSWTLTYAYFDPIMSEIEHEIVDQPRAWTLAAKIGREGSASLPAPGKRVCAIGCGTSYYVAQAYAAYRERAGLGETDAFPASETPAGRPYDHFVAITRSGTTSEVLSLLAGLSGTVPVTALTGAADSPVTTLATESIMLDFADERSFVQTRFATSALVLLRAHLGDDIAPLAAAAETAIAADPPANPADFDHFVFVGTGPGAHLASEAALKMRETGGAWTEAYPAMELRHGPMSALSPRSLVWSLGAAPEGLGDEVARTGATWLESAEDPLVALVRVQRLAVANALAKGLDPDHPPFLSRSVVLPGSA
jgi:fructoselysine-6-P-deglycase FrlB-like protein